MMGGVQEMVSAGQLKEFNNGTVSRISDTRKTFLIIIKM